MPKLESYRKLAPYSMNELVDSVNSLLRFKPELAITPRVVRFYISEGLLPPPEGPPKLARYSYEHLLAVLAIRGLQDRGVNLSRIGAELNPLWSGRAGVVEGVVAEWLRTSVAPGGSIKEAFEPSYLYRSHSSPAGWDEVSRRTSRRGFSKGGEQRGQDQSPELARLQEEVNQLRSDLEALRGEPSELLGSRWKPVNHRTTEGEFGKLRNEMSELRSLLRQVLDSAAPKEAAEGKDSSNKP